MLKGFRDFLLRGNVVDLAVAVIIGAAFNAIVTSLVEDIITPLIGLFFSAPDFSALKIAANPDGTGGILIGNFINAVISFLLIASVVYFAIVAPMNRVMERMRRESPADAPPAPSREEVLLAEIRDAIREQRR